jgi:cyclopropane-fatty-acyl-phospholipid synthase
MVDDYTVGALGWVKTYEAHLGEHYAETLRMWRARFRVNREMLQGHFEETFLRMWEYYLSYCEAGFRSGDIGLVQLGFCSR